jgi:hypothetical protein
VLPVTALFQRKTARIDRSSAVRAGGSGRR